MYKNKNIYQSYDIFNLKKKKGTKEFYFLGNEKHKSWFNHLVVSMWDAHGGVWVILLVIIMYEN